MFLQICEVCKSEPQFKTVTASFPDGMKKLNVCMDCAYSIEEMEERENKRGSNSEQSEENRRSSN